jgi:hypothetical protein
MTIDAPRPTPGSPVGDAALPLSGMAVGCVPGDRPCHLNAAGQRRVPVPRISDSRPRKVKAAARLFRAQGYPATRGLQHRVRRILPTHGGGTVEQQPSHKTTVLLGRLSCQGLTARPPPALRGRRRRRTPPAARRTPPPAARRRATAATRRRHTPTPPHAARRARRTPRPPHAATRRTPPRDRRHPPPPPAARRTPHAARRHTSSRRRTQRPTGVPRRDHVFRRRGQVFECGGGRPGNNEPPRSTRQRRRLSRRRSMNSDRPANRAARFGTAPIRNTGQPRIGAATFATTRIDSAHPVNRAATTRRAPAGQPAAHHSAQSGAPPGDKVGPRDRSGVSTSGGRTRHNRPRRGSVDRVVAPSPTRRGPRHDLGGPGLGAGGLLGAAARVRHPRAAHQGLAS